MIVVDASAALEVLLNTPAAPRLRARLFAAGESLHAPHLLDLEVVQVLRRYSMAREIAPERGLQALADLREFPLERYAILLPRIWELRHNLTAYDAAYLALAEALEAPLVTCDRAFSTARAHSARVEFIPGSGAHH